VTEWTTGGEEPTAWPRQGAKATKYALDGLAAAQKQKNRDLEGHFKELMAAAQK
jgi:hypothetical protein